MSTAVVWWCVLVPLSYIELASGVGRLQHYKSLEPAYVDQVVLLGGDTGTEPLQRVYIKLRIEVCACVCACMRGWKMTDMAAVKASTSNLLREMP